MLERAGTAGTWHRVRSNPVGLVLKRVGRQRDTPCVNSGPQPFQRHGKSRSPSATDGSQKMESVIAGLFGMRQAVDDLVGTNRALRLDERCHGTTGSDFDVDSSNVLCQDAHPLSELDLRTQMRSPVSGIAGLRIGEPGTREVRDNRYPWFRERRLPQISFKPRENGLQHPGVGGNIDGYAHTLNVVGSHSGLEAIKRLIVA